MYLQCGSFIEATIDSIWDIPIYVFNNTFMDDIITISTCGSSIDTLLVLKSGNLSVIDFSANGCEGTRQQRKRAELKSQPLPKGVYIIHILGQNEAIGDFSLQLDCYYPTYSPTYSPTTAEPTSSVRLKLLCYLPASNHGTFLNRFTDIQSFIGTDVTANAISNDN